MGLIQDLEEMLGEPLSPEMRSGIQLSVAQAAVHVVDSLGHATKAIADSMVKMNGVVLYGMAAVQTAAARQVGQSDREQEPQDAQ